MSISGWARVVFFSLFPSFIIFPCALPLFLLSIKWVVNSNSFIDFWDKNLRNLSNKRLHSRVLHVKWIAFVTGAENIELYNSARSLAWILIVITDKKWTQAKEVQHLPIGFAIPTEAASEGWGTQNGAQGSIHLLGPILLSWAACELMPRSFFAGCIWLVARMVVSKQAAMCY